MSYLALLIGALAGCALRLYVLARRERRDAEQGINVELDGISQATLDRMRLDPSCPLHLNTAETDPHELAQWLADQTGNTILLRQIDGDGLAVALPSSERASS